MCCRPSVESVANALYVGGVLQVSWGALTNTCLGLVGRLVDEKGHLATDSVSE